MKEINIGKILINKRKEKGITQEELAAYIGVSKASVSKWETGQSYPDITFLPQLATYFNISIDELIGYTPQMTKEQIRELYHRLADKFASQPFEQVYDECEKIIKKYYSCFPLLLQMAVLYLNHYAQAADEQKTDILEETLELCIHIRSECENVFISTDATMLMAHCYLFLRKPEEVLALFGETIRPIHQETEIMAQAYQLMGKIDKSIEAAQISIYQHLLSLVGSSSQLLMLSAQDPAKVDEIMNRTLDTAKIFQLEILHPNLMAVLTLTGAQVYCGLGNTKRAIELLNLYVETIRNFFPVTLHGDRFFNSIDSWLEDFDLGTEAPRSETAIKKSLLTSVSENPALAPLAELPEFQTILAQIKSIIGGN